MEKRKQNKNQRRSGNGELMSAVSYPVFRQERLIQRVLLKLEQISLTSGGKKSDTQTVLNGNFLNTKGQYLLHRMNLFLAM